MKAVLHWKNLTINPCWSLTINSYKQKLLLNKRKVGKAKYTYMKF